MGLQRPVLGRNGDRSLVGAGAGYEIQAKRQMDRLEEDYRSGRIDRREYEIRKQQIERGSLIY